MARWARHVLWERRGNLNQRWLQKWHSVGTALVRHQVRVRYIWVPLVLLYERAVLYVYVCTVLGWSSGMSGSVQICTANWTVQICWFMRSIAEVDKHCARHSTAARFCCKVLLYTVRYSALLYSTVRRSSTALRRIGVFIYIYMGQINCIAGRASWLGIVHKCMYTGYGKPDVTCWGALRSRSRGGTVQLAAL